MTLVNCKISNYPLGEPDNQNPINNIALNSSVNLNTLPSHVKLVITPNNNTENPDGYYAVRAEDFHIGGLENYLNQSPNTWVGYFQNDDGTEGTFPSMVHPIVQSSGFGSGTVNDPALNDDVIESYVSDLTAANYGSEWWGLGFSPYALTRNQLSIDTFGEIGGDNIPGRIYHFHGVTNVAATMNYYGLCGSGYPNNEGNYPFPCTSDVTIISPQTGNSADVRYLQQFYGLTSVQKTFPADTDISLVNGGNVGFYNQNYKGISRTTSWKYINRIMICDSLPNLGDAQDGNGIQLDDNYPIDNEVHVWVELRDDYILNQSPADLSSLWNLKVDIDGAAKFIET